MIQPKPTGGDRVLSEVVASGVLAGSLAVSMDLAIVDLPPWFRTSERPACQGSEGDLFFPDDYTLAHWRQIEAAKALCGPCPLLDLCRGWAVPQADLDGVWAALTPPERRRIRTGRAA